MQREPYESTSFFEAAIKKKGDSSYSAQVPLLSSFINNLSFEDGKSHQEANLIAVTEEPLSLHVQRYLTQFFFCNMKTLGMCSLRNNEEKQYYPA